MLGRKKKLKLQKVSQRVKLVMKVLEEEELTMEESLELFANITGQVIGHMAQGDRSAVKIGVDEFADNARRAAIDYMAKVV